MILNEDEIAVCVAIVKELTDEEVKSFTCDKTRAVIYKIRTIKEGEKVFLIHHHDKK
jgi:hypothetical protein